MAEYRLEPGQQRQFPVEHRYLRVSFASAPVEISGRTMSAFDVKNREVIDMVNGGENVTITNRNDFIAVIILDSIPRKVSGIDEVALADGSSVTLAPGSVLDLGEVSISADAQIEIKPGSSVAVSSIPPVSVDSLPAVVVDSMPAVSVSSLPPVTGKVKKDATGSYVGMDAVIFTTSVYTVPDNVLRKELHVKTGIENAGLIWLGSDMAGKGIPLEAGEGAVFEVSNGLQLFGAVSTDVVYLSEVVE